MAGEMPREREMILRRLYDLSQEHGPRETLYKDMGFEMEYGRWELHVTHLESQGYLEIVGPYNDSEHSSVMITEAGIRHVERNAPND